MKTKKDLRFKMPYSKEKISLESLVSKSLDGGDYERGAIETVEAQVQNVTKALARLLRVLSDENRITDEQVFYVAQGTWPSAHDGLY